MTIQPITVVANPTTSDTSSHVYECSYRRSLDWRLNLLATLTYATILQLRWIAFHCNKLVHSNLKNLAEHIQTTT
jgi:hypothetical protein